MDSNTSLKNIPPLIPPESFPPHSSGSETSHLIMKTSSEAPILGTKNSKRINKMDIFGPKVGQQFLIMSCVEEGKSFEPYWPYKMFNFLKKLCPGTKTKKLRNGSLLIETSSNNENAKKLLELESYEGMKVKVELHKSLNYSKGVVSSYDLLNCTEEEILNESKSQGVVEVKRLYKRQFGESKPTPALILTFTGSQPPERINAGFVSLPVRHYIPNPLRCFKCWSLGHIANNCTIGDRCKLCSAPAHPNECATDPVCINCKGPHSSISVECIKFKTERRIQEIKVKECISYREALRKVRVENDRPVSYAKCVSEKLPEKSNLEDLVTRLTTVVETLAKNVGKLEEKYEKIMEKLQPGSQENVSTPSPPPSSHMQEMEESPQVSVIPSTSSKKRPQTPLSPCSKINAIASPPRKILGGMNRKGIQKTEPKRELRSNSSSTSSLLTIEDLDMETMDIEKLKKIVNDLRKKGKGKR